MKFDSKCHLSTKLFAEHSKIASQPINWKVNKCHFVVLVVNKCHFVVLVVNKCHFVVLVVNKCHFVVLVVNKCHFVVIVVRKRSRNDFTLLKRVLKLCNNVANYGTNELVYLFNVALLIKSLKNGLSTFYPSSSILRLVDHEIYVLLYNELIIEHELIRYYVHETWVHRKHFYSRK